MSLSLPSNPTTNQTFSAGGRTWYWTGSAWELVASGTDPRWAYFIPAAPTNVTAYPGNASAFVAWTAPATIAPPLTGYVVQYSTDSANWTTFSNGVSATASATVTGLTNGTAYTFRVASVNGIGTSAFSTASTSVTPNLLLDVVTNAAAAYSLRVLRAAYTGPVARVRRSSDSTQQDFTASQITDGTLTTFTGSGNGYVVTWYDQSGNGLDASQPTAGNQPDIVTSGALILLNGKPSVSWTQTTNKFLYTASSVTTPSALSYTAICSGQPNSGYNKLFQIGPDNQTSGLSMSLFSNSTEWDWTAPASGFLGGGYGNSRSPRVLTSGYPLTSSITTQNDVFGVLSSSNAKLFANNAEPTYSSQLTGSVSGPSSTQLAIGNGLSGTNAATSQQWYGRTQELVIWFSDQYSNRSTIRSYQRGFYLF
jgi:Fibronectin type III domain